MILGVFETFSSIAGVLTNTYNSFHFYISLLTSRSCASFLNSHGQMLSKVLPPGSAHLNLPAATVYSHHLPGIFSLEDLGLSAALLEDVLRDLESSEFLLPGLHPPTGNCFPPSGERPGTRLSQWIL